MKLIVVIVTYNGMKWIDHCLSSLTLSTIKPDVFLVDNGSNDGTQEFVVKNYPEVIFRQSKDNLGFGRANNLGLQYALDNEYDYVYLLNQDAWVEPNTFEILIDCLQKHPEYGIVSPLQCQANKKRLDESFLSCLTNMPQVPKLSMIINESLLNQKEDSICEVDMTMAAHWMMSKKCLEIVGGFSPTFPHYGEDVNYNDRMHYHQLKMGVALAAKAVHDRENREVTKNKLMHVYYTCELAYLSNPNRFRKPWYIHFGFTYIYLVRKHKAFAFIRYFFVILARYKEIMRNKRNSIKECAFLCKDAL